MPLRIRAQDGSQAFLLPDGTVLGPPNIPPSQVRLSAEEIAEVAHEANRAYCLSMGDASQKTWKEAPEWARDSAINGVKFHFQNPTAQPSASHESWLKQKLSEGWKFGPAKDPEKKEHPCCVPYEALPAEQKAKDYIYSAVVKSLLCVS